VNDSKYFASIASRAKSAGARGQAAREMFEMRKNSKCSLPLTAKGKPLYQLPHSFNNTGARHGTADYINNVTEKNTTTQTVHKTLKATAE